MQANLLLDSEWEQRYTALDEQGREEFLGFCRRMGISTRNLDPMDYSAEAKQRQADALEAELQAKADRALKTPISVPADKTDRELAAQARRLGLLPAAYASQWRQMRQAALEAEEARKMRLQDSKLPQITKMPTWEEAVAEIKAKLGH